MSDDTSILSSGIFPSSQFSAESTLWGGIISNGVDTVGIGPTLPASVITPTIATADTKTQVPTILSQIQGLGSGTIVPTSNGYMDLGSLSNTGITMTQAMNLFGNNNIKTTIVGDSTNFTGIDLKLLIECAGTNQSNMYKELIECHTISVTSYRMKTPIRANGYTNPKGFARGGRTIAGTMILTEMSVDVLLTFLQSVIVSDHSKDSQITKTDQLPPFNITMIFANEEGYASYRVIIGLEFLNDGTVYSVQDLMTERTISWMASDFTPLLPLDVTGVFTSGQLANVLSTIQAEKTPLDLMQTASTATIPTLAMPQYILPSTTFSG